MNVTEYYELSLDERGYSADPSQRAAVERLQSLYDEWVAYRSKRSTRLTKLLRHPDIPRGVYLWGGVGRGKSFLMDCFHAVVPVQRKTRVHFHEFMREVHHALDEQKDVEDPLLVVAEHIAQRYRLICFDEFHVSDIADAMILYNLLQPLFDRGVSFVMTSNYAPDALYPDGLHRDRMLPAIALIKDKLDVLNVDAGTDYRKRILEQVSAYHAPLGTASAEALEQAFTNLAGAAEDAPKIRIESRDVRCVRRAGGVAWFDFATLCGTARSQNDYLEIANRFHTVILSDVPKMSAEMASEARRFTWLIDVLYDHRIKLLISAEVAPDLLFTEGSFATEFQRAVSRIVEMQSREYKESERRTSAVVMGRETAD
ncbi:COG1485 Predicted ATPase [Oxalobacteraceae bacterium]|jgi:cell division protein ZapE|nr:cell division protein ZapE [Oxalobacteraceae bacterium]